MRKNAPCDWQSRRIVDMLLALCFGFVSVCFADGPTEVELREALEARRQSERRCAELEASLAKARDELTALQRRYADLYLASQEQRQELEYLELRAGHLLSSPEEIDSGRTLARILRELARQDENRQELAVKVREFGVYLASVLDVLQPSQALRGEVEERIEQLQEAAEHPVPPLPGVAGRGDGGPAEKRCRVLAVNDELQVIVLDRGFAGGVRPGSRYRIQIDGDREVRIRALEVRAAITAAVVEDGHWQDVAPGARADPID